MSKSIKYIAEAYINLLNGKDVDLKQFCTLAETKENLNYLFWD